MEVIGYLKKTRWSVRHRPRVIFNHCQERFHSPSVPGRVSRRGLCVLIRGLWLTGHQKVKWGGSPLGVRGEREAFDLYP